MQFGGTIRRFVFIGFAATLTAAIGACSHNREYYDPYTGQTVTWNNDEDAYYRRWEAERRMSHIDYRRRAAAEQRAYWDWRRDHR
jgi:hypothetical protein